MDRRALIAAVPTALFSARIAPAAITPFKAVLLIADYDAAARDYVGGLDIQLDEGWKTYWRMPGDAGIPPDFDWSASQNVSRVEVLWPAPQRFDGSGGETVGYKHRVVFPLRIVPANTSSEVTLELSLFFGVCRDICIPGKVRLSARSGQADPKAAALIATFAAKVPREVDARSPFRVSGARLGDAFAPSLAIGLEGNGYEGLDIFVEGADFAYFKAPRWQAGRTSVCFVPFVTQGDPGRLRGRRLKLTMVASDIALEQDVVVA